MSRLLDIIIPEYNTKQDLLVRALNSVNRQKNVDFNSIGIIIVSDGSKTRYKKSWFKQRFPKLNIDYYYKEKNEGPGLTRQFGIDKSEAKFITFLDSDDELYENNNFSSILGYLDDSVESFFTLFVEEIISNGVTQYRRYNPQDFPTLHGLFVKRSFLIENNISFSNEIRYQEDTYFAQVLIFGYDSKILPIESYLWKNNEFSLVRTDKKENWNVKIIEDYIKSAELVYKRLSILNKTVRHHQIVTSIYGAYIILQATSFDKDEERRIKNMKKLLDLYNEIKDDSYNYFTDDQRKVIFERQLKTTSTSIQVDVKMTFDEYLKNRNIE